MINLLGEKDSVGPVNYKGVEEVLKYSGVYIHLYGKKETKPYRKMGHITVINDDLNDAIKLANEIKKKIKVVAK